MCINTISGGKKMLDLKFLRENPEIVKQNIRNKFQDKKLPLVDEVIELDAKARATQTEADELRANRNKLSKQIGALMAQGKKEEAEAVKAQVSASADRLKELEAAETELNAKVTEIMMKIPNIIDPSVPIGKDDSENVEIEKFGEPVVPDFEIPYHTDIMAKFNGIDLDAAGKVAGNGFYYLMGDIASAHHCVDATRGRRRSRQILHRLRHRHAHHDRMQLRRAQFPGLRHRRKDVLRLLPAQSLDLRSARAGMRPGIQQRPRLRCADGHDRPGRLPL